MWATSLGNVPFPLLSDRHPAGEMIKAYGLWNDGRGTANRAVIIVDKEGIVRFRKEYEHPTFPLAEEILPELDKLG